MRYNSPVAPTQISTFVTKCIGDMLQIGILRCLSDLLRHPCGQHSPQKGHLDPAPDTEKMAVVQHIMLAYITYSSCLV